MSPPNPSSRRSFLGALVGAAVAPAALAAAPDVQPPASWPAVHEPDEADCDACNCRACDAARHEPGEELRRVALAAAYRADAAVEVLHHAHARRCRGKDAEGDPCGVCHATPFARYHLEVYIASLERDLSTSHETEMARLYGLGLGINARQGRFPPPPRPYKHNEPWVEPALVAVLDLRDALDALLDGHGCEGACDVCHDADGIGWGVQFIIDCLANSMRPISPAVSGRL